MIEHNWVSPVFGSQLFDYLSGLCLNFQLWDHKFDGTPLNEDSEKNDKQGSCQKDVLEWIILIQNCDQGETNCSS